MVWKNAFQFSWRFMGIFCSLIEFRLGVEFGDPRIFFVVWLFILDWFDYVRYVHQNIWVFFLSFCEANFGGRFMEKFLFLDFYLGILSGCRWLSLEHGRYRLFIYYFLFHYFYFDVFLPLILVLEFFSYFCED